MILPWKLEKRLEEKDQRIEELESKLEELRQEKQKWEKKFQAEEERRSELSRKKQEAEEERNRLRQKLQQDRSAGQDMIDEPDENEFENLGLEEFVLVLKRLESVKAGKRELVTVYSPGRIEDLSNQTYLKNSVSRDVFCSLRGMKSFIAFIDPVLGAFVFRLSPFFSEKVEVDRGFAVDEILEFVESEKHWCLISAGETEILREESWEFEQVDRVKSRVDREHSKGGFSQGRFERKRDEQIEKHREKVAEKLEEYENVYLLGDEPLCRDLEGEYLGGFDPNRKKPEQFYRLRFKTLF